MIDKKTVFVLGAGASCPYGYPSSARLREWICHPEEFLNHQHLWRDRSAQHISVEQIKQFKDTFAKSSIKSIDTFMANNPKLAPAGKYLIAFEILRVEQNSLFGEEVKFQQEKLDYALNHGDIKPYQLRLKPLFQGGDWYFYLYNRLIEGLVGQNALPDFSDGKIVFITFNYDRSLEHFLYVALRNSFTEISEDQIVQSLKKLKILHVYGQIAPLKWQNPNDYIEYKQQTDELLLQRAANNIRTIYEEKQNPELIEAQSLLKQAKRIFFLGFGYAQENMDVLNLPGIVSESREIYGTAFGAERKEIENIHNTIFNELKPDILGNQKRSWVKIEDMECLKLLRNYL